MFLAYTLKQNLQPNKNFKNYETECQLFHFPSLKSQGSFMFSLGF